MPNRPLVIFLSAATLATGPGQASGQSSWLGPASSSCYTALFVQIPEASRRVAPAVLWLGLPGEPQGTAFVVSRKHRLAVTAAHVADLIRQRGGPTAAYLDGTTTAYHVERVWYHPGVLRKLDDGLVVRSDDPKDGAMAYPCPDVAILQLSADGPDLPAECTFASDDELNDLQGRPVGMLGHPYDPDNPEVDGVVRPHGARLATGLISRVKDFHGWEVASGDGPLIGANLLSSPGTSGSPGFLSNGHIVAVFTWGKSAFGDMENAQGVRADCIRKAIVYHKLGERLDGWLAVPVAVDAAREGPDGRLPDLRRAVAVVRESFTLYRKYDFRGAATRCDEALKLAPEYCTAHVWRAQSLIKVCGFEADRLTREEREAIVVEANDKLDHCLERDPRSYDAWYARIESMRYLGLMRKDHGLLAEAAEHADAVLTWDELETPKRAALLEVRGWCRYAMRQMEAARNDLDAAVDLEPEVLSHLRNRAYFHEKNGHPELAAADLDEVGRREAERLVRSLLPDLIRPAAEPK